VTDVSSSQHRQAWDLIPWIVNGTASEAECQCVQEHVQSCADCREELEFQRRLQRAVAREAGPEVEAHSAWTRMRERLDGDSGSLPTAAERFAPRRLRRVERTWLPWVMAAMLVQGVGLGVLGTALWPHVPSAGANAVAPADAYHTLSASLPAISPATVRVVLAPTMTLAELRGALASARLQVVSGPSDAYVWSLAPAGEPTRAATDAAVRALRATAGVRFAEPISAAP